MLYTLSAGNVICPTTVCHHPGFYRSETEEERPITDQDSELGPGAALNRDLGTPL